MADKLRLAFASMEAQMLQPAPQRLAQRLLLMAEGHGTAASPEHFRPKLNITQEELARMLGVSRQTINQILQNFKDQGWIHQQRGELDIRDAEALRRLAQ
jgi:CRP/FNR family transcriptional regulator, cyclic AMP receptor protein